MPYTYAQHSALLTAGTDFNDNKKGIQFVKSKLGFFFGRRRQSLMVMMTMNYLLYSIHGLQIIFRRRVSFLLLIFKTEMFESDC